MFLFFRAIPFICRMGLLVVFLCAATQIYAQGGAFSLVNMTNSARSNGSACGLGRWDTNWLGPQSRIRTQPAIALIGTDLAYYKSNTEPVVHTLYRMNVQALRKGSIARLKGFMLTIVSKGHFTTLQPFQPQTWHGNRPAWLASYNGYNEPVFNAAVLLIAVAQSYVILEPHLSSSELTALQRWGHKVYQAAQAAPDGGKGVDRRAAKAAGFTNWGLVTRNSRIFNTGRSHFRSVVRGDIAKDGRSRFFSRGNHRGLELKYMTMTYGFLSVAAAALEAKSQPGFTYNAGRGSLAQGLNYLISRTFNSSLRTKISPQQNT